MSAKTASRPVSYKRTPLPGIEAYRVNGTPGDCVMLGTTLWAKVDVVLSGINIGTNLGNAVWHSGTLAGAKQAALLGMRGIAFSAPATEKEQPDFNALKPWVSSVLEMLLAIPDLCLVNVNFPDVVAAMTSVDRVNPEIGLFEDPITPTRYPDTVAKKNPVISITTAARIPPPTFPDKLIYRTAIKTKITAMPANMVFELI